MPPEGRDTSDRLHYELADSGTRVDVAPTARMYTEMREIPPGKSYADGKSYQYVDLVWVELRRYCG